MVSDTRTTADHPHTWIVAELGWTLGLGRTRRRLTAGLTTGWLVLLLQAGNQSDVPEVLSGQVMQHHDLRVWDMALAMGSQANGDVTQVSCQQQICAKTDQNQMMIRRRPVPESVWTSLATSRRTSAELPRTLL